MVILSKVVSYWCVPVVFDVRQVFLEPCSETPFGFSDVLEVALCARELVYYVAVLT